MNFEKIWNNVWSKHDLYSSDVIREYVSRVKAVQIVNMIRKAVPQLRCTRIADIGCGDGRVLIEVGKRLGCKELIGIDISRKAIEKAKMLMKKEMVKKWTLKLGEATNIPINDNCCNVVLLLGVIEHYSSHEYRERVIKEIYRILEPKGVTIVMTPNKRSFGVLDRIMQQFIGKWPYGFQKELSPTSLLQLLKNGGFSEISYCVHSLILVPNVRKPFRLYLIKVIDDLLKTIVKDFGFYLYGLGIKRS